MTKVALCFFFFGDVKRSSKKAKKLAFFGGYELCDH